MKNFIQPGEMMEITAAAAISSGDGVLQNDVFGVAVKSAGIGEKVNLALCGVFELAKLAADDMGQGVKVYWDNTNKRVTLTAMGNKLVGVAFEAAAAASTKAKVRLDGVSI